MLWHNHVFIVAVQIDISLSPIRKWNSILRPYIVLHRTTQAVFGVLIWTTKMPLAPLSWRLLQLNLCVVCCLLLSGNTGVDGARTPDFRHPQLPCWKADRQKTRSLLIGSYWALMTFQFRTLSGQTCPQREVLTLCLLWGRNSKQVRLS